MVPSLLRRLIPTKNERELKRVEPLVGRINALEPGVRALSDAELAAKTPELKGRIERGEALDALLPEAFAVCREALQDVLLYLIHGVGTVDRLREHWMNLAARNRWPTDPHEQLKGADD